MKGEEKPNVYDIKNISQLTCVSNLAWKGGIFPPLSVLLCPASMAHVKEPF